MSAYADDIAKVAKCSPEDALMIEYIMRQEIFHSTLDWLSEAEFNRAARKGAKILAADREIYEEHFRLTREAYRKMHAEQEAAAKAIVYEI